MQSARFHRERQELALRLDEVIRGYLSEAHIPEVDDRLETVYGQYAIGDHPQTREMQFFLENLACFTPDFANRLHALVAREFPKWAVVPQYNEQVFTVAAAGATFGDSDAVSFVTAGTPAYQAWLAGARRFDEAHFGPLRRQLAWLIPRLPAAVTRLQTERAVVLGSFDRLRLQDPLPVVWLLLRDDCRSAVPVGAGASWYQFPVDGTGTAHPRHCQRFDPLSGEDPFAVLASFSIPPGIGPLLRVEVDGKIVAEIPSPAVVRDDASNGASA